MEDMNEQMDGYNGVAHSGSDEDGLVHNDDKEDSFFTKQPPVKEEQENKRVAMSDDD